jgi:hypothetical protein
MIAALILLGAVCFTLVAAYQLTMFADRDWRTVTWSAVMAIILWLARGSICNEPVSCTGRASPRRRSDTSSSPERSSASSSGRPNTMPIACPLLSRAAKKKPRVSGAEFRRNVERPHMRDDRQTED